MYHRDATGVTPSLTCGFATAYIGPSVALPTNSYPWTLMELFPLAKGILRATCKPLIDRLRTSTHAVGGNVSARYCYSVWMRHLVASRTTENRVPVRVVELGPGLSLGTGFCARLCGVMRYSAVDAYREANLGHSLSLLPELTELVLSRTRIPDETEFPGVWPRLSDYSFPDWLQPEETAAVSDALARTLRNATAQQLEQGCAGVRYVAPWTLTAPPEEIHDADFVFSQAVFEHVADVDATHRAVAGWLAQGGLAAHTIDFRSHGMTRKWYGHWLYPTYLWRIVAARSNTGLNRLPLSYHLAALDAAGFEIVRLMPLNASPSDEAPRSLPALVTFDPSDLKAKSAYVCARKRPRVEAPDLRTGFA